MKNGIANLFCKVSDLDSEADVESLFVERLLTKLHYPDNCVKRKDSLSTFTIARGVKKESYKPDYVLLGKKKAPRIVVDAKAPDVVLANFLYQVSGYALALNQQHRGIKPVRYVVLTNGHKTLIYPWDENKPCLELSFSDFEEDNPKFIQLRSLLTYGALEIVEATEDVFEFNRPELDVLIRTFDECHNIIWKKEKIGPTLAFYEFAKIMFVKMREDHRIANMIADGKQPKTTDFNFSVAWIREQVEKDIDENPLASILFNRIRNELEIQIQRGEKKRIFLKDETLTLKLSTVIEVVRSLEHFDLHGIDEDLNGRMFETFLNATVRGKELGQFFTPRSAVKYMTITADLKIVGEELPKVFDGCCGSAGFLIEAMAVLVHQIDQMTHLTDRQRKDLKKKLYSQYLWGCDANDNIARIARLNMYLHGDGGSKIFVADTLDKTLEQEKGLTKERSDELDELRGYLIKAGVRFDTILTNPPFSMSYKKKDEHAARVLNQYDIAKSESGAIATSARSNVLFIERYLGLLKEDGQLLTVIDDTVLNGFESQKYRDYILEHFIIKQVISLPFNTFRRAEAGVKTSILHLKRKENDEKQGDIFMAILNNIGHDDHKRSTPNRDNFTKLKEYYRQWTQRGVFNEVIEYNNPEDEHLSCPFQVFILKAKDIKTNRLDAFYYAPELRIIQETLQKKYKSGEIELRTGKDYNIVAYMNQKQVDESEDTEFKYIDISAITQTGAVAGYIEGKLTELPGRARLQIKTNDVLFAKLITSRGINLVVPKEFDDQIATTGFIGIRCEDHEEALMLWTILKSDICTKQIYYLAITALQPELREETFRTEFLIPVPKKEAGRKSLVKNAKDIIALHEQVRSMVLEGKAISAGLFKD